MRAQSAQSRRLPADGQGSFRARVARPAARLAVLAPVAVVALAFSGSAVPPPAQLRALGARSAAAGARPVRWVPRRLIFDGRAQRLTYLRCDHSVCTQKPVVWSALQFCNDDITRIPDPRFGEVYRYRTDSRSNLVGCPGGPIWSPAVAYASLNYRPSYQVLGTIEYYRESIKLPPGFTFIDPGWESLMQYGFGPYNGAVEIELGQDFGATHFELQWNGGRVVDCAGPSWWQRGNVFDLGDAAALEGHWVDFIVGIDWRTDGHGWVDIYKRVPGLGQTAFKRKYHLTGRPTYQWGTCGKYDISRRGTNVHGAIVHYMDQQNDYEGYWDKRPIADFPTHSFVRSGMVITPTLATAKTVAP